MKNNVVAAFPLSFVRAALQARGKGFDYRLWDRFGYMRAKRMAPATVFSRPDLSYVHCGAHPLVACVEMSYYTRWRTVAFAYYSTMGELVVPA